MINYRSFEIAVNSVMTTLRHLKARKKALAEGSNKPYVTAGARGVRGQKNSKNFNLHNRGKAGSQKPIRKVLERMKKAYPELENPEHKNPKLENRPHHERWTNRVSFFEQTRHKKDNQTLSEDVSFCYRVNEMGMETWIYPWGKTTHYGKFAFECDLSQLLPRAK